MEATTSTTEPKVYCRNCKYQDKLKGGGFICQSPDKPLLSGINKDNNCKYYKRKWYKFWVK